MKNSDVLLEIHTHTIASGHAYGTMSEMVKAAHEKGLKLFGISEHGPGIPGTCDPMYFLNFEDIPRFIDGVELLHGSEINILNDGTLSLDQRHIDFLDYGIAGIHRHCYHDEGKEKNTENMISCMKNDKIFFISHPDDDHTPLNYEKLVLGAKKYHVALEVNNSSLRCPDCRLNCVENYKTMLSLCMQYQVPIIISSDAHFPTAVGNYDKVIALLNEIGFDENLVLNNDIQKFKNFIRYQG